MPYLRLTLYKKCKNQLYSTKSDALNDKRTDQKVNWTVLNNFLNDIKIRFVHPILISGETITNIIEKTNIFNGFFNHIISACVNRGLRDIGRGVNIGCDRCLYTAFNNMFY